MTEPPPQEGKRLQGRNADGALEPNQQARRSYNELVQRLRTLRQDENELWEQHDELRDQRQELISTRLQQDAAFNPTDALIRDLDTQKEYLKDQIGRLETAIERESHGIERLEDLRLKAQDEGRKLGYEWFKHLTTLGTGSIVILGSLLNNLLSGFSEWTFLIPIIFVSLFVAVVSALIVMYLIYSVTLSGSSRGTAEHSGSSQLRWYLSLATWPTLISFSIGILSLVAFVLKNIC